MSRFLRSILAAIVIVAFNPSLYAQNWATKLGFPPEAIVIIFSARETGISWEANVAAQKMATDSHSMSLSVVV